MILKSLSEGVARSLRRVGVPLVPLMALVGWGCGAQDVDVSWVGVITGQVVGDDVGPDLELADLDGLFYCAGGRAFERFFRRPDPDGSFRIVMGEINTGPRPRCFHLVVGRDGTPFDTLRDLGPVDFYRGPILDSLFLRIRVFGSDSASVIESVTLPGGAP